MKIVELTKGYSAVVDDDDFSRVSGHKWRAHTSSKGCVYAKSNIKYNGKRKTIYLHRYIFNMYSCSPEIDHIDGDGLNCTRKNLRIATPSQNRRNQKKQQRKCTSKYKGVRLHASGLFEARVYDRGRRVTLGYFKSDDEAAEAYNIAATSLYGEFARLNVIEGLQ